MLAKLNTFALVGTDGVPVEVQVDEVGGLPKTVISGTIPSDRSLLRRRERGYRTSSCVRTCRKAPSDGARGFQSRFQGTTFRAALRHSYG
jgi:hypothetical protein